MNKSIKRCARRYKNEIIKRKIYWLIYKNWYINQSINEKKITGKLLHTRKSCNCNMCKNPRKSKLTKGKEKYTIQELKFIEGFNKYGKYY
jgi:hypothetical protein